jgi:protein required for attachment to host cells
MGVKNGHAGMGFDYPSANGDIVMTRLIIPARGWILVCDGSKALLFQNEGDGLAIDLDLRYSKTAPDVPTRDIGTDRPGRSFSSVGGRRSAVENPDLHDLAEQKFLGELVGELDNILVAQKAEFLVIAAPARAMGLLRPGLGKAARDILKAEITKDLCRMPVAEIEAYLQAMREMA